MKYREIINKAIDNEKYIDYFYSVQFNVTPKYRSHKKISKFLDSIFVKLCFTFGIPFFFFIKFLILTCKKNKKLNANELFLVSSNKSKELFDFYTRESLEKRKSYVQIKDVSNYLSFSVKLKGLLLSLSFVTFILKRYKEPYYFQDALELILFILFLEKNNGKTIFFTNHYDRWSVIIDSCAVGKLIQFQHGIVCKSYTPPYKLANVSEVYCMDNESILIWQENIVSKSDVKYHLLENKITFNLKVGLHSLLIISNPFYFDLEKELISGLLTNFPDLKIYFKAHPVHSYNLSAIANKVVLVRANIFPDCRLSVTKGSTLGKEYEFAGKKVIWWSEDKTLTQLIQEIRNELIMYT